MGEMELWDAMARRRIELVRTGEALCRVEWEDEDPLSLYAELVTDNLSDAMSILAVGCLDVSLLPVVGDVVALDLSRYVLDEVARLRGCRRIQADSRELPFGDEVFDLICLHPMPGWRSDKAFSEIARVLRPGGMMVGITDGETRYIEAQEIFGRGYQWPPITPVRFAIPRLVLSAGLELGSFSEHYGVSYCRDIGSFALEMAAQPVIPSFDPARDAAFLREVERKLMCEHGVRNTEHAAVFAAWKSAT